MAIVYPKNIKMILLGRRVHLTVMCEIIIRKNAFGLIFVGKCTCINDDGNTLR